ncbi:MAG: hypothetical protein K2O28_05975 [Clostridia bacterium]|nr:hypothetical protein [Clostridia bacterium]
MSKYLKSLITACLVICMTVCLGIFAAACTGGSEGGDGGETTLPTSVSVTVLLDDGTPAVGVSVQICTVSDDGTANTANCKLPKATDAQGVATIDIAKTDGNNFEVHVLSIPDTYAYYSYVDANGTPYAEGTGARVDITKSAKVTVKLAVVSITDKLSEGTNIVKLDAITDTLTVKANIESAGWYKVTSYTNAFLLSGTGFNLTNDNNEVNLYLNPNDELTFSFVETEEPELLFTVGLAAHEADGTEDKPLPAVIGSQYVISLAAEGTVYITNDTVNSRAAAALDVTGNNFYVVYGEEIYYNEAFTLNAPETDGDKLVPETIEVSTAEGDAGVVTLYFAEHVDGGDTSDLPALTLDKSVTISGADFFTAVTYTLTIEEDGAYLFDTEIAEADIIINTFLENGAASMDNALEATNGAYTLTAGTYYVSFYNNGPVKVSWTEGGEGPGPNLPIIPDDPDYPELTVGEEITITEFNGSEAYYSLVLTEETNFIGTANTFVSIENADYSAFASIFVNSPSEFTLPAGTYKVTVYNEDGLESVTLKIEVKTEA